MELKPCPWCRSPAMEITVRLSPERVVDEVACSDRECQLYCFRPHNGPIPIQAWNSRRVMPPEVREVVEEMKVCPLPQNWASENVTQAEIHLRGWIAALEAAYQ